MYRTRTNTLPCSILPTVVAACRRLIVAERKSADQPLEFVDSIIAFLLLHLSAPGICIPMCRTTTGRRRFSAFASASEWDSNAITTIGWFTSALGCCLPIRSGSYSQRHARLRGWWPGVLAICVVLAASAVYEIGEWATAMTFAPDWAEAYNGQQGDMWDAQKDMALAAVGSILGTGIVGLTYRPKTRMIKSTPQFLMNDE